MTPVCRPLPTDGVTVIKKLQLSPILGITVKLDAICWKWLAVALVVSNYKDTQALFFHRFAAASPVPMSKYVEVPCYMV